MTAPASFPRPRAWWMLRAMGHEDVVVLDGGLPEMEARRPPARGHVPQPYAAHFTPRAEPRASSRDFDQMMDESEEPTRADGRCAQAPAAFRPQEPEPRPGVAAGHIPGSFNIPYTAAD